MNRTKLMTPTGGILALVCFFMPWIEFSCENATRTLSGYEIATRQFEIARQFGVSSIEAINPIFVALFAAVAIVAISLYMLKNQKFSKVPVFLCSLVGIAALFYEYYQTRGNIDLGDLGKYVFKDLDVTYQWGVFGTILGFILASVGVCVSYVSNKSDYRTQFIFSRENFGSLTIKRIKKDDAGERT